MDTPGLGRSSPIIGAEDDNPSRGQTQSKNRHRIVEPGGGFVEADLVVPYLAIRYTRSPASFLLDSILTSCFFPAVEINPRTL
jgi:hypothetical protein